MNMVRIKEGDTVYCKPIKKIGVVQRILSPHIMLGSTNNKGEVYQVKFENQVTYIEYKRHQLLTQSEYRKLKIDDILDM